MITRIPSIWSCKTLCYGWLNLALAQQLQPCSNIDTGLCVLITWSSGKEQLIDNEDDAKTVMASWLQAERKYNLNQINQEITS